MLYSLRYFIGALEDLISPLNLWLRLLISLFTPVEWYIILVVIFLLRVLHSLEVTLKIIVMPLRLLEITISIVVTVVCSLIMLLYRLFILVEIIRSSILRPIITLYPVVFLEI